jgi:multicomponent Na+:H+ antiporter subunit F
MPFDPIQLVMGMLTVALFLGFIRLVRGPSLPDRVVALDMMSTVGLGMIATYAVVSEQAVFIDVIMVVALIAFVATLAFARYVEKQTLTQEKPKDE